MATKRPRVEVDNDAEEFVVVAADGTIGAAYDFGDEDAHVIDAGGRCRCATITKDGEFDGYVYTRSEPGGAQIGEPAVAVVEMNCDFTDTDEEEDDEEEEDEDDEQPDGDEEEEEAIH